MKFILRTIEILLVILAVTTFLVVVFLYKPNWSPFQEPTFGNNVIPVATLVAAWTTLFVAYAAFRTIRSNREKEERDRKHQLLNEIIEWAVDISKCGIEKGYPDISNLIESYSVWLNISDKIGDIILCFKEMRGENQYVGEVIKILDHDLGEASKTLIDEFEEHIKLLLLCETYMKGREKAW
ncbi:unnamed protein product, partial [marine sediment metagenome]